MNKIRFFIAPPQKLYYGIRILYLILFLGLSHFTMACTVFILTNGSHTYFFNNEDNTNPNTRLWFIPEGKGHYGCAYVGFNDGESQGGVNTKGLAFDWVTVDSDTYETDPNYLPEANLIRLQGNSSQYMLERCKTVREAIKFYQTYREPAFAKTTLIIADKSGTSVIIGSKDGKIYFDTARTSRGMGYGEAIFQKLYKPKTIINLNEGAQILGQCVVSNDGGTKYSNSYDLKTGDIVFYNFSNQTDNTKLNLFEELKKGSHYYEIPQIKNQTKQPIRQLMLNMNRNILFNYKPLKNQEPEITSKIQNMFSESDSGKLKYTDLTENFSNDLKKDEINVKSMLQRLGKLISLELIYEKKEKNSNDYSYVIKFQKVTILWQFLFNDKNKVYDFNTLSAFWIK
jgi:hypothetical protein